MKIKKLKYLFFIYFLYMPSLSYQNDDIADAKFIIKKDKKFTIYDIDRFYFPSPIIEIPKPVKLYYNNKFLDPNFKPLNHKLRLLKAKQFLLANHYDNLIGVGCAFTNAKKVSGLLKFICGTKKNERYYVTNHGEIFIPDYKNQIYFNHSSGRYLGDLLLSLDLNYERLIFKRRDEPELEDDIKTILAKEQALNNFEIYGNIDGIYNNDTEYKSNLGYELFKTNSDNDIVKNSGEVLEHNFISQSKFSHSLTDYNLNFEGILNFSTIKYQLGYIKKNKDNNKNLNNNINPDFRNLFQIGSIANYTFKNLIISGGANIYTHNDEFEKKTLLSPLIKLESNLSNYFKPYIKLTGGEIQKNSYSIMLHENPLMKIIKENTDIKNICKTFNGALGFNSNLPYNIAINGNIEVSKYLNFASFSKQDNGYKIIYNKDLWIVNPNIELDIKNNSDTMSINFHLDLFKYGEDIQIDYEPRHKINILGTYKIQDKLFIRANIYFSGGAKEGKKDLDEIIDTGIGFSYVLVDNLLLNLDFENILLRLNEKYEGVSGRSFRVILGIGYRL